MKAAPAARGCAHAGMHAAPNGRAGDYRTLTGAAARRRGENADLAQSCVAG
jgi:hypothetical protein